MNKESGTLMQFERDYKQMVEFVRGFIESHDPIGTELVTRFPFRRRFEHCLRCSKWARRISVAEGADVEICVISALFHDVGKSVDNTQNHGGVGAEICEEYLKSIGFDIHKTMKIVEIVRNHSSHIRESDTSLESKVVSDADLLDETGTVTVLWDAMACAGEVDPSYEKACERIDKSYARLKVDLPDKLHTTTARQILKIRLDFIGDFLGNLEYELGHNETIP